MGSIGATVSLPSNDTFCDFSKRSRTPLPAEFLGARPAPSGVCLYPQHLVQGWVIIAFGGVWGTRGLPRAEGPGTTYEGFFPVLCVCMCMCVWVWYRSSAV